MYKRLLVPVDGSVLSEYALEDARNIIAGCGMPELYLLTVVEPFHQKSPGTGEDWNEVLKKESSILAQNYLDQLMQKLKSDGLMVKIAVVEGNPSDKILEFAEKNNIDLIVMTTHGRSGARRWIFGSVAQKVIHNSAVPVIIVPARKRQQNSVMSVAD